jgi:hypothetical protein
MLDDLDIELVPVFEYLMDLGFDESVASKIALHALIRQFSATLSEIKASSEECGYALPYAAHLSHDNYKDRN